MSRWVLPLAVAVLTMIPSALAKGPDTAQICGSSGCVTASTPEKVNVLALYTSGFAARKEPAAAPFFTVELTSTRAEGVNWSFIYVPSAKALQIVEADFSEGIYDTPAKSQWVTPSADVVTAYGAATESLSPFPATSEWTAEKTVQKSALADKGVASGPRFSASAASPAGSDETSWVWAVVLGVCGLLVGFVGWRWRRGSRRPPTSSASAS